MPKAIYEGIYREIRSRIINGTYAFQEMLPTEAELTAEFGCTRNTVRRVEIACPIRSPEIRRRLHEILDAMLADTVKARVLLPDGTYTKKPPAYEPVCAQVLLMKRAVEAAQQQSAAAPQEKRSLWEKLFHRKGR